MRYTVIYLLFFCSGGIYAQSSREVEEDRPEVDNKRQHKIERRHRPDSKTQKPKIRMKSFTQMEEEYEKRMKNLRNRYSKRDRKAYWRYIENFGHKRKVRIRPLGKRKLCKECGIVH